MPYIPEPDRERIDGGEPAYSAGELNYAITKLVDEWLGTTPSYGRINAAIGVFECAKLELYRRVAAPYEDTKIAANGDVYRERPRG